MAATLAWTNLLHLDVSVRSAATAVRRCASGYPPASAGESALRAGGYFGQAAALSGDGFSVACSRITFGRDWNPVGSAGFRGCVKAAATATPLAGSTMNDDGQPLRVDLPYIPWESRTQKRYPIPTVARAKGSQPRRNSGAIKRRSEIAIFTPPPAPYAGLLHNHLPRSFCRSIPPPALIKGVTRFERLKS